MILSGEVPPAGQLNRLQTRMYHAIGSGTVVGAATNADVPSASVTVTTEVAGATYTAVGVWDVSMTAASTATGTARIMVDGAVQSPLATFRQSAAGERATVSQTYSGTLAAAGTHTIKLVASPGTGHTVQGVNSSILVLVNEIV